MADYTAAFLGGTLIGIASVLMLLINGKILGISGIIGGMFQKASSRDLWRYFFLFGLFVGGRLALMLQPHAFDVSIVRTPFAVITAGLLVGFGTRMGSGCTSGHGVCGVSRLSPRSVVATITFMFFGALTVFIINHFFAGQI